jgi:cellulose synthase/poly-beta-1,6-N-acetylglucosamine synthase-like glycosyltransferase
VTSDTDFPRIGVVIIGVNAERYLADCIESVRAADYPQDRLEIVYSDGGSTDATLEIARAHGARIVPPDEERPTPSGGRNSGWRALDTTHVLFLDCDTMLDPAFLKLALPALRGPVAAVCGQRYERYPYRNVYHLIMSMEWRAETGYCRYFGGDVLILRDALEKTNGYDVSVLVGEDPELSYRVRKCGFQVVRLDTRVTTHDINMSSFRQYWKRAVRTGYSYVEVCLRHIKDPEKMWLREVVRIVYKALLPIVLILAGAASGHLIIGLILGLLVLARPLFSFARLQREYRENTRNTLIYVLHSAFVVYPQFIGMLRYFWGRVAGKPLRNKPRRQALQS